MRLLILGANSDLAEAVAAEFARNQRADLVLASRNTERLEGLAQDLRVRYQVQVEVIAFDAADHAGHAAFYQALEPKPDGVVAAFGYLGDQQKAQGDWDEARAIIDTNYIGAMSILEPVAADLERRGRGFIIAFSSVAGLRGRKSNYIYGSAKGGLYTYLGGLNHRLASRGVRVLTVLPGFARTKMTQGLDLPEALTADPQEVAADVYKAWQKGKSVVYSKWMWRWIMLIIRLLPGWLFNKTNL